MSLGVLPIILIVIFFSSALFGVGWWLLKKYTVETPPTIYIEPSTSNSTQTQNRQWLVLIEENIFEPNTKRYFVKPTDAINMTPEDLNVRHYFVVESEDNAPHFYMEAYARKNRDGSVDRDAIRVEGEMHYGYTYSIRFKDELPSLVMRADLKK